MKNLLNAIIEQNAKWSKAEILEDLIWRVNYRIKELLDSLHLVDFKGFVEYLPGDTSVKIGDSVILEKNQRIVYLY